MRLFLGIIVAIVVGIYALGAVFDSLTANVESSRRWPITRESR